MNYNYTIFKNIATLILQRFPIGAYIHYNAVHGSDLEEERNHGRPVSFLVPADMAYDAALNGNFIHRVYPGIPPALCCMAHPISF